jgi:predicted ABC-type ATPase
LTRPKNNEALRLRVFAGPNGSGKSTIIQAVKDYKIKDIPIDFGIYINADDIAVQLRGGKFRFSDYEISTSRKEFINLAIGSGLLGADFTEKEFTSSFRFQKGQKLALTKQKADERIAQIITDFLRKKLLEENRKFSFETVFSHPSKLDIMRQAKERGYKVYLYFVSTESPEINIYRVQLRKEKGGHDVPVEKIRNRYIRSLDLVYEASQLAYQAFFFDNSKSQPELFAHFKMSRGKKNWDRINEGEVPGWFRKYYSNKVTKK